MITITFNAFSFLQPKLRSKKIDYSNAKMTLKDGITLKELIIHLGLQPEEVEAAFVNHRVVSLDSTLHHNDRVALVPPGTPGPYRVLLNLVKKSDAGGIHETR